MSGEHDVSVVIPTCGRADVLRATLQALLRQSHDLSRIEIIVVCDGPDPATRDLVHGMVTDAPCTIILLEQARQGQGVARNTGIARTRGRVILMLDDDIIAVPQLISSHLRHHSGSDNLVVSGALPLEPMDPEPAHHRVLREWWEGEMGRMAKPDHVAGFQDFVTGNVSVARSRLLESGCFDSRFTGYGREDYELGYRLLSAGLRFVHEPAAIGVHRYRKSPLDWIRQFEAMGHADVIFARKHPYRAGEIMRLSSFHVIPWVESLVRICERTVLRLNKRGGTLWAWAANIAQGSYYWRGVRAEARDARELDWLLDSRKRGGIPRAKQPGLVSVVIPCYNHARFLAEAIESVRAQTYSAKEIIVVDDGSTDDTAAVAERYEDVRLLRQPNSGLAAARNAGFRESNGSFTVFLDADDRLLPSALEAGVTAFADQPRCAFVAGRYDLIAEDGSFIRPSHKLPIPGDHYAELLRSNFIAMHATVMFRAEALESMGGFRDFFPGCEDYHSYILIARTLPIHCHGVTVAEYRQHGANMSRDGALMLANTLGVLRTQRRLVKGDAHLEDALRCGVALYREYYGEPLIADVKARFRERAGLATALYDLLVLVRHYPGGLIAHGSRKIPVSLPGRRQPESDSR